MLIWVPYQSSTIHNEVPGWTLQSLQTGLKLSLFLEWKSISQIEEPKALLLLDNDPSHSDEIRLVSKDKKITAMFLPANTTALIQPMDQGVLQAMKNRYMKSLLRKLLMADKEGQSMTTFVKSINIKDVVYMIGDAWDNIESSTLCKSWFKIVGNQTPESTSSASESSPDNSTESCEDLLQQLDSSLTSKDIENYLSVDWLDPGYQYATDNDKFLRLDAPSPQMMMTL